jgi:hypothetical protein
VSQYIALLKKKRVTKLVDEVCMKIDTWEDLCKIAKLYFDTLFKIEVGLVLNLI